MKNNINVFYRRIEVPKEITSVAFGLLTLVAIRILTSVVNFRLNTASLSYVYDFSGNHQVPLTPLVRFLYWITYGFNLAAPIIAGIIIGFMLKKRYMKYALIMGFIAGIVPIFFILTYLFWPERFFLRDVSSTVTESFVYTNIVKQLFYTIRIVLLAIVGGYIGNKVRDSSTKQRAS